MLRRNKISTLILGIFISIWTTPAKAIGQPASNVDEQSTTDTTLKSIRSLAKHVNANAMEMAHEFNSPKQLFGKAPNIIGPVVVQPMPSPNSMVYDGQLPPGRGILGWLADDTAKKIDQICQLEYQYLVDSNQQSTVGWTALQKSIFNLKLASHDLVTFLAQDNPKFVDVGSRIVAIYDLSRNVEKNSKHPLKGKSSQMTASTGENAKL